MRTNNFEPCAKGLERLENSGGEMIGEGHFAATEIERIVQELKDLLAQLENALKNKRKRLQLQLRVEEFRAKKQNANVWICEKLPAARNDNFGASLGEVNSFRLQGVGYKLHNI